LFWLKFILIVLVAMACGMFIKYFLRTTFHIEKEKRKFFSYNHINATHRKIDWGLRIGSLLVYWAMLFYLLNEEFHLYFILGALFFFTSLDYLVRAYFEWKHTENPRQSILTISELAVILIAGIVVIQFNLFSPYL
jgi:uncharacterized membrane protein HdeD (DUF308 family)